MSFLDIILGLFLVWGLWRGLKNGLFIELASIVALIAGIYGAIHFSYFAGDYLAQNMDWDERYINLTAFVITFFIVILVVQLLARLLTKVAQLALLGWLNRLAGGIFGVVKVAVILGALLVFFDRVNTSAGLVKDESIAQSVLYEPIKRIGALIFDKILEEPVVEKETFTI
ncbi:MAG TPA: CvpA family protein [Pricia sp.]|nr:CvpA family protein [Pricia sp.]